MTAYDLLSGAVRLRHVVEQIQLALRMGLKRVTFSDHKVDSFIAILFASQGECTVTYFSSNGGRFCRISWE